MNRVQEIEQEVEKLSPGELADFRDWFAQYDAEAWDRQLEQDFEADQLDELAERALRDHKAGKSQQL